jgi:carbon starvation protein CstA
MVFNMKNDLIIGFNAIKQTTIASLPEIFIIALTMYCLMNNLNRFSNKNVKYIGLRNKQLVFSYALISLILVIILVYCKLFFITDSINRFTIVIPILFILVPCISGIALIYLETNDIMSTRRIGKSDENEDSDENTLMINKNETTKTPFSKIPYYVTSKNIRIILQIGLLILIIYNFITTSNLFEIDDKRTVLNSLLTNNLYSRPTKAIMTTSNYILIILNIIIIIQQYKFKSCKLNLPLSWDF